MKTKLLAILLILACLPGWADEARRKKLDNDIRYLVNQHRGALEAGIAIIHPASGEVVSLNGQTPFPLASVFKVPIMIEVARRIQAGSLSRNTGLTINEAEKCIGSGQLQHSRNGTTVSVDKCMRLMMSISDNTATDMLFNQIGHDSVNKMMESHQLTHSDIFMNNRTAWLLSLGRAPGLGGLGPVAMARRWQAMTRQQRHQLAETVFEKSQALSLREFQAIEDGSSDQTDQEDATVAAAMDNLASPEDMGQLLAKLVGGELLDRTQTAYCLDVMAGQKYHTRIPSLLDASVPIYHKTGTLAGIRNDAGIIELPSGEYLIVVGFTRNVKGEARADRLIAQVARLAYRAYR
ncbi:MAG: serine hydrolase [Candidatus Eremiobacteraeota bacterium]|nr:serine hydrolase [Candidatus Eremiobacteraeota bacterium]